MCVSEWIKALDGQKKEDSRYGGPTLKKKEKKKKKKESLLKIPRK